MAVPATAHDDALIARARAGDERAYAELVRAHEGSARRTAVSIAGASAGEDATQEAYIKAYRKLGTFRLGSPFRPWFLRIVANEARNARRSAARHARLAERAALAPARGGAADELELIAREERAALLAALDRLPVEDRIALLGRFVAELDDSETARLLGVRPASVRVRIWRALERLRHELAAVSAVLLAAAAVLALSPTARSAARAALDLVPGVAVEHVSTLPPRAVDVAPPYLGVPGTRADAERVPSFAVVVPSPEPERIYVRNDVQGGMVTFFLGDGATLTEWWSGTGAAAFDVVGDGGVRRVDVEGNDAVWIDGSATATYTYIGADRRRHYEALEPRGTLLLWQRGSVAYRLEGALSLDEALRVAGSL
jgi:RNA polymerase sigma factor (sigma-70 family)